MKIPNYSFLMLIFLGSCFYSSCSNQESQKSNEQNTMIALKADEPMSDSTKSTIELPVIDGSIGEKEWHHASKRKMYGGDSVFFLKSKDTIFIAVRGNSGGFTSMGFSNGDQIKILHASTGLITAEYAKSNNNWNLVYNFKEPLKPTGIKYPRNDERLGNEYKKSQQEQFGWYANLIEMGSASETEFIIPVSSLPEGELYFSLVFYQIKSTISKAKFPEILNDAMLNQELISGSARDRLDFKIETWASLSEVLEK